MAYQWAELDRYTALATDASTQGNQANAKDDTLFYASGGFPNLETDLSQHADNMTDNGTWTSDASPSTRFDVSTTWAIEVLCSMTSASTGYFFNYGGIAGNQYALSLNGAGSLQARLAGAVIGTLALPGVSAFSAEAFVLAWSCEPNIQTTGAGDALRSELRAWNTADGTYAQTTFTHAIRAVATSAVVCWAQTVAGAANFNGTATAIRISAGRFRTATETHEDFVATTAAPTITGQSRIEHPVIDPASAIATAPDFAGPIIAMASSSVWSMHFRTLSPIVNEQFLERNTYEGSDLIPALPTQFARVAADALYTMMGCYLFYRRVPAFADRLKCRVELQQWRTAGALADRVHARVYSLNRPPHPFVDVDDGDKSWIVHSCGSSINTTHGSGSAAGEWVDLGLTKIARNSRGCSWLVLAIRIQDLSGTPANNRLRVNALTIEPVVQ